ncbi:MAG: winged helix-turn-helix transcriptional regulator [bacterium]|nr:winged helix-turn-helix transcriptional regulator [bacterium]
MSTNDPSSCAAKLKALADTTRLAVMESLLDGPRRVGELGEQLGVEQSLLSHHLRVLREMELLEARRDGKAVVYALAPGVAAAMADRTLDLGCCQLSFETST